MANLPPNTFPSPDPKYPYVGPNYQKHQELLGYDYNYLTDRYRPNKEAAENAGLIAKEPVPPGLLEQVAPMGLGLGVGALMTEVGKGAPGFISGLLKPAAAPVVDAALSTGAGSAATPGFSFGGLMGGTPVTAAPAPAAPSLIGSAIPSGMGSIGALPLAGIGLGLLAGAKGVKDLINGKEGTSSLEGLAGRGTLGIATGGLSELARLAGVGRRSTKDYQSDRWGALSEAAQGLKAANHPGDDTGIFGTGIGEGEKWSMERAIERAKVDPKEFIGVLGNLETFGDPWLALEEEKQKAVVAKLLEAGLYNSNKGDILIGDQNKTTAMDIFNSIINPTSTAPTGEPMSATGYIDPNQAKPIDPTKN